MPRTNAGSGVTVTSRALAVLAGFDAEHRSLSLTEIARRAGLTLPTAHRLVGELTAWGALHRTGQGRYVIGRRLWDLGMLAPVQTDLRDVASPFLNDLYGATLATVHLAVRDGTAALYLDRIFGHASVPVISKPGGRLPLHSTGVGKVLLAYAPPAVRARVLGAPLERFTPYTVTQPGRLAAQLRRIPRDGYATTAEEMTLGACSVAIPVTVTGRTVASLGVVVPDLSGLARLVPAMQVAAQGIARCLRLELLPFNGSPCWPAGDWRPYKGSMRTDVAIIGAGPAGLLLAHLLHRDGIESVVIEARSRQYVAARIRAGILESSSVELLREAGLGAGIAAAGDEHRGIYLQWPRERHHLDFVDLVGRSVWVYGQTQLQADLVAASDAAGRQVLYSVSDVALHDLDTDRPCVTFTDSSGAPQRIEAAAVAGCDGSFGPSRAAVPAGQRDTWERVYPYSWLGILADVAPSTDELIYAWHPDGFALHSMRSASVSRFYLQVPNGTEVADWPDARIWEALASRLGHGQDGWELRTGPITDKSVLPMRSFVQSPMRCGRLFLAGDAAHTVPPTGAKGLNLAIADVALLAPALGALVRKNDASLASAYSETALRRVWRCEHFSWWMTSMLHISGDPFDAQLQLSQLRWVTSSTAGAAGLAENYAGLPIGF